MEDELKKLIKKTKVENRNIEMKKQQLKDYIYIVVNNYGVKHSEISLRMNKSKTFFTKTMARKTTPTYKIIEFAEMLLSMIGENEYDNF